jgi:hypothetical protein
MDQNGIFKSDDTGAERFVNLSITAPFKPFVIQSKTVIENIGAVCSQFPHTKADINLRVNFFHSVNNLQKFQVPFDPQRPAPLISFADDAISKTAVCHIISVPELIRDNFFSTDVQPQITQKVNNALLLLENVAPDVYHGLTHLVGALVFARDVKQSGGSVSDLIGVIWLGPDNTWEINEYAANILHEYVHQSLFLDEMVNTIFSEPVPRMHEPDALVVSSILRIPRGYDRSYHSAFVAFVLMQLYSRLGLKDLAHQMVPPLVVTVSELLDKQRFLTPHGLDLVLDLVEDMNSLGLIE